MGWLAILQTGETCEPVFSDTKWHRTKWSPSIGELFLKFEEKIFTEEKNIHTSKLTKHGNVIKKKFF